MAINYWGGWEEGIRAEDAFQDFIQSQEEFINKAFVIQLLSRFLNVSFHLYGVCGARSIPLSSYPILLGQCATFDSERVSMMKEV